MVQIGSICWEQNSNHKKEDILAIKEIFVEAKPIGFFAPVWYPATACTISFILDKDKYLVMNINPMITKSVADYQYKVSFLNDCIIRSDDIALSVAASRIKLIIDDACAELNGIQHE